MLTGEVGTPNSQLGNLVLGAAPVLSAVTGVTKIRPNSAKLEGTVQALAGGTATYYFKYWKTGHEDEAAYAPTGKNGSAAEGEPIAVSETVRGLATSTEYTVQLIASNSEGEALGPTLTFLTLAKSRPRAKPDLALDAEVETPDGYFRLSADSRKAGNKPQGLNFGTQRGDGFTTGGYRVTRDIFRDYPDLNLLDTHRFVGHNGEIAYESKLHSQPRGNNPKGIDLALVGWATYLKSRPINPLIIDCRTSGWGDPSTQRRANQVASKSRFNGSVNAGWQDKGEAGPGVTMDFTSVTTVEGYEDRAESWFYAGGQDIAELLYHFVKLNGTGGEPWVTRGLLSSDDIETSSDPGENHKANTNASEYETLEASEAGRKYAKFASSRVAEATGTALTALHNWAYPKVIGNHGLTLAGSWPEVGFKLTDIMEWIVATYYPKLTWAGTENPFVVTQAAFQDARGDGYTILRQLAELAAWDLAVWEDRKLYFEPADLTSYDWQVRTDDPGVEVHYEGDSIENFANGIAVTYTDIISQQTRTIYPDENEELLDESESNPANRHSEDLWTSEELPYPGTEAEAVQYARARLVEFNRPKRVASYTLHGGYIEDFAGHLHQGWKVRSGQTIGRLNFPDDSPGLIEDTQWNQDDKSLTISVDAPSMFLDAVVARIAKARETRGVS